MEVSLLRHSYGHEKYNLSFVIVPNRRHPLLYNYTLTTHSPQSLFHTQSAFVTLIIAFLGVLI